MGKGGIEPRLPIAWLYFRVAILKGLGRRVGFVSIGIDHIVSTNLGIVFAHVFMIHADREIRALNGQESTSVRFISGLGWVDDSQDF